MRHFKLFMIPAFVVLTAFCALAQESREVKKTVPLTKDGSVMVDTYKGSVHVDTWDKGEVEITALIESDDWGRYDEENVRDTEIRIDASAGAVRIKTDYKKLERRRSSFWDVLSGDWGNLPSVHYTIRMPSTAQLKIKDYKSEIDVNNLQADMDLNTYKGEVDIRSLKGGLTLETYKGECKVEFARFANDSRFETYKGEIRITLPSGSKFGIDADIGRRGELDSDFQFVSSDRRRSNRDYWVRSDVNGGGPSLRLRTDKGSFRIYKQ